MFVTSDSEPMRHCAFCLKKLEGAQVKLCVGCHRRAYCSRDCQSKDWSSPGPGQGHKNWCKFNCGEEDLDWRVQLISPEKGMGIVAIHQLPKGFRILVEKGLRQPFDEVHKQSVAALEPKGGGLRQKLELNELGCGEEELPVLCIRLSRANHSCRDNASHWYDSKFQVKVLTAVREIQPGEEISISYTHFDNFSNFLTPEKSRSILQQKWGIVCPSDCLCRNEVFLKKLGEATELDRSIFQLISQCRPNPDLALVKVERLLKMEEELDAQPMSRYRTLHDAFQVAVMQGKTLSKARAFARRAYEIAASVVHPTSHDAVNLKNLAEDPSSHPNYLWLNNRRK